MAITRISKSRMRFALFFIFSEVKRVAKYECKLTGNFDEVLQLCEKAIMNGSISASFENGSDFKGERTRMAVRVYERYSVFGGNRVSLSLTLISENNDLFLTAITSGGSQAVFFKINTLGEDSFLEVLVTAIKKYNVACLPSGISPLRTDS